MSLDYSKYLQSEHWADLKRRYRASKLPQVCRVCGCPRVQMHHVTYKRLGAEWLNDLVPLCGDHHWAVHVSIKERGRGVRNSNRTIRRMREGRPQPAPREW